MRLTVTSEFVEVHLNAAEKVLGLMGDLRIPRADIYDAEVVEDPLPVALRTGIKVGLRLPGWRYIARTIRLDEVLIVRRGVPGLSFRVRGDERLQRVLLSTPDATRLAGELSG